MKRQETSTQVPMDGPLPDALQEDHRDSKDIKELGPQFSNQNEPSQGQESLHFTNMGRSNTQLGEPSQANDK